MEANCWFAYGGRNSSRTAGQTSCPRSSCRKHLPATWCCCVRMPHSAEPRRRELDAALPGPCSLRTGLDPRRRRVTSRPQPTNQSDHHWNCAVCNSPRTKDGPDESDRNCYRSKEWPDAGAWHFVFMLWFGIEAVCDQHFGNIVAHAS